ncbi:hypothetical protein CWR43_24440 [Rhizobium sullae]|uniref:Secreted protein n=1 Tax=Rhizobium sullae TaxID=50338 RepID=A0A2N0D400_RHISU|nr:hypothetical protein [Rhizobium sullae]PKA40817.1 hypothetical protein CWR43_24440 [Rhizobium sullae]
MFIRLIAGSIVAAAVATTAFAQTTGTQGGSGSGTTIAPNLNDTGSATTTRTNPGISNSTINPGAVDLNRSGSTVNPGGVNPAIPSPSTTCTNSAAEQDSAATGTSGLGCPPLPR